MRWFDSFVADQICGRGQGDQRRCPNVDGPIPSPATTLMRVSEPASRRAHNAERPCSSATRYQFCPRLRRAARPYKPRRLGGLPGTAGFDTQVDDQSRWPEGIRGSAYEADSPWFDSTQRGQFLAAGGLRQCLSEGRMGLFDSVSRGQSRRSGPDSRASSW